MEGFLVIAAIVGFIWFCSKMSQANKEYEERKRREAADRWEEQQRRIREAQERKVAEERRKHEEYLQKRRTNPLFDMAERQKEERAKAEPGKHQAGRKST